jgi:hypothetical protein
LKSGFEGAIIAKVGAIRLKAVNIAASLDVIISALSFT